MNKLRSRLIYLQKRFIWVGLAIVLLASFSTHNSIQAVADWDCITPSAVQQWTGGLQNPSVSAEQECDVETETGFHATSFWASYTTDYETSGESAITSTMAACASDADGGNSLCDSADTFSMCGECPGDHSGSATDSFIVDAPPGSNWKMGTIFIYVYASPDTSLVSAVGQMALDPVLDDGGAPVQCNDGADNDGDSLIDFPNDPGCDDAADNDETNGGGGPTPEPPPPPPSPVPPGTLYILPNPVHVTVGEEVWLFPYEDDHIGNASDWYTADDGIATPVYEVSDKVRVLGVSVGTTELYFRAGIPSEPATIIVEDPTPLACPFSAQSGRIIVNFPAPYIYDSGPQIDATSGPVPTSIPAGTYTVSAFSYDFRHLPPGDGSQPHEQWLAQLFDSSSNLIQSTSVTTELGDGEISHTNAPLNVNFDVPENIASVSAYMPSWPQFITASSITPGCVAFDLVSTQTFDYVLSNAGNISVTKSATENRSVQNTVTKILTNGSAEAVSLDVSGVPSGVSYSISGINCSPTCQSVITFTVAPSATTGTYLITVTGTPLGHQTSFNLTINPGAFGATSCSVDPNPSFVGRTASFTSSAQGTPPITYLWSGDVPSPAPTTANFTHIYTTSGPKSVTVTFTDGDSNIESCVLNFNVVLSPNFREF